MKLKIKPNKKSTQVDSIQKTFEETFKPFYGDYDYLNNEEEHPGDITTEEQKKDSIKQLLIIVGIFLVVGLLSLIIF